MTTATQLRELEPDVALTTLENLVGDGSFWLAIKKKIHASVNELFANFYLAGMEAGITAVRKMEKAGVRFKAAADELQILLADADTAAQLAMEVTAATDLWWSRIDATSRRRLFELIDRARRDGYTMPEIISRVSDIFGPARAEAIAVTETTRLFGAGQQASYAAMGIEQWNWETAGDDHVDQECEDRADNGPYPMDNPFEPAHVGCRCWPTPAGLEAA